MSVPFDQRVYPGMLFGIPGQPQLQGYGPSRLMTPAAVESLVLETERLIEEPIRHVQKSRSPQPIKDSIQQEVERAWKAPKRALLLSTRLFRKNYVCIGAERHPRPTGGVYPADFGRFCIQVRSDAPRVGQVLGAVRTYARVAGAFMARTDSPHWMESMEAARKEQGLPAGSLVMRLRFLAEEGWGLSERIGWGTYVGPRCAEAFGALTAPEVVEQCPEGGLLFWITKEPFDFRRRDHFERYVALRNELAPHLHPGHEPHEL